ncbi:TPA: serine/threonine protein kinase [Candidatus Woesearchaeota archaeon]|nr:serine/threonine protein kinase [Candidatus Woesearchaeota archaeon]
MVELIQGLKDEYEVIPIPEVGRGGYSVVGLVRSKSTGIIFAHKIPALQFDGVRDTRGIVHEASVLELIASNGGNPNIIALHDRDKDCSSLILPYYPQRSLRDYLKAGYRLTVTGAIVMVIGICDALSYLKQLGIVHCDIKPGNILLDYEQPLDPVVFDFNIALVNENEQQCFVGTPYYMAPEMMLARGIDHRTDIYSLGATLYHMLTGEAPFTGKDASYNHVHTPPKNPREINPAIPEALAQTVLKCLEKKPEDRYQTALGIKENLEKVLIRLAA